MSDKILYSLRGGNSGDFTRDDVTGCCCGCCGSDVTTGSLGTVVMATGAGAGALTTGVGGVGVGVSKKDGILMTGRRSGLTVGLLGSLL